MSNLHTNIIAVGLFIFMFFVAVFSMAGDSASMDEVAHLPSGYSYLTQRDMRLNPEHPPLIKDLAALPLLFIKGINFPSEIRDWQEDINAQWGFGFHFLYGMGNPVDQMMFRGRIPMVLLLVLLGIFIFKWTRERFGNKTAILALFFYSFSPTFLAHGGLVTTDVAAAAGVVLASYYFLKFLYSPTPKNIILAGIAFGIAQLLKFSLVLLYPFFFLVLLSWVVLKVEKGKIRELIAYGIKMALLFIIGFLVLWPVYQFHVLNLPTEKIEIYSQELLKTNPLQKIFPPSKIITALAENPITKPWSYYLLGVFMVTERAAGGHTTYFLGEVSNRGWVSYFPIVYIIKEPLAFHIFTILALFWAAYNIKRPFWEKPYSRVKDWIKKHFTEFVMIFWIILYWLFSLSSNLNIGVRHLLPTFPFIYILVSIGIVSFLETGRKLGFQLIKYVIFIILILWQAISIILIYPHFLSYFNEIAGGPDNGYVYTVNSNLDWGQDLKRLKNWVDEKGIDEIYVDYFGGGDAQYYLGEKFREWHGDYDPKGLPQGSYLAVSATFLQGGRGIPIPGLDQPLGVYWWLYQHEPPITKIGYSIFVYQIK